MRNMHGSLVNPSRGGVLSSVKLWLEDSQENSQWNSQGLELPDSRGGGSPMGVESQSKGGGSPTKGTFTHCRNIVRAFSGQVGLQSADAGRLEANLAKISHQGSKLVGIFKKARQQHGCAQDSANSQHWTKIWSFFTFLTHIWLILYFFIQIHTIWKNWS